MPRLPRLSYLYPSALAHLAWLCTFGLFSPRGRLRVAQLGYESPWLRSPLPTVKSEELIGDVPQLTLHAIGVAPGNTSLTEQIVLARLAETSRPQALFEFGTFDGRSSLNLIAHAPPGAHLYTLDLPASQIDATQLPLEPGERAFVEKTASGTRFLATDYASQITRLYGDSATFDFSPYQGSIDLVFVDASHAYDYVRSDSLQALKLLRRGGGRIVWHDYSTDWPGVVRALDEFYRAGGPFRGLRRVEGTTLVMLEI
jgi:hypothetical protein